MAKFNSAAYKIKYCDVAHFNDDDAFTHFLKVGSHEGRSDSIPIWFDWKDYTSKYSDLHDMDAFAAWWHFTTYGMKEGRRASIMPSNAPVQIFTMVKNEVDIAEDWVHYHAAIVGLDNVRVIDNMSTDGTYEALLATGVGVIRLPDYKLKGAYMTELCALAPHFAVPLDIDEFVVDFNGAAIQCACMASFLTLPKCPVYKMTYIQALNFTPDGYVRAAAEATHGSILDYGDLGKSFFYTPLFAGVIDHGNHYYTNDYHKPSIALVHYHFRNPAQHRTKVITNVKGLGYSDHALPVQGAGIHHVNKYRKLLAGDDVFEVNVTSASDISLDPLRACVSKFAPPSVRLPTFVERDPKKILVVVARYNESLEWLNESPFTDHQYIVYNKGTNDAFVKTNVIQVIKLANVGRCDHTYLFHVVKNYANLPPVLVFFPGSIDLPHKRRIALQILKSATPTSAVFVAIFAPTPIQTYFGNFHLDSYRCLHPANFELNPEKKMHKSRLRPFGKWFDHHFGSIPTVSYQHFGVFSVNRQDVVQHPVSRYLKILAELAESSNPEVGHYCERAWSAIFYPLKTTRLEL